MNAKAEQKRKSHETILDSATQLLREKGIAGARVADVMQGAGLTVGGFYAHFESKEDLVDASLRRMCGELRAQLFAGIDEKPAADRAVVVLKRYLSTANRDEDPRRCPFPSVVGEVATSAPEHRGVLGECVDLLMKALETTLPDTIRASRRRQLAVGLAALMYGGLGLARSLQETKLSDEILSACRALGVAILEGERT